MKNIKTHLLLFAVTIIALTSMISCGSPSRKVDNADANVVEAKKTLVQAQKDYAVEVENFKKVMNEKIIANEVTIADIKEDMKKDEKSAKADYKILIIELQQKNSELKRKMEDYKETDKEKWQSFKTEFNHDMDELGDAIKNLTIKNDK